jgi:hypothetical protein
MSDTITPLREDEATTIVAEQVHTVEMTVPADVSALETGKSGKQRRVAGVMYTNEKNEKIGVFSDEYNDYKVTEIKIDLLKERPVVASTVELGNLEPSEYAHQVAKLKGDVLKADNIKEWDNYLQNGNKFVSRLGEAYKMIDALIELPIHNSARIAEFVESSMITGAEKVPTTEQVQELRSKVADLGRVAINAGKAYKILNEQVTSLPETKANINLTSKSFEFEGQNFVELVDALQMNKTLIKQGYLVGISKDDDKLSVNLYNKRMEAAVEIGLSVSTEEASPVYVEGGAQPFYCDTSIIDTSMSATVRIAGMEKTQLPPILADFITEISGENSGKPVVLFDNITFESDGEFVSVDSSRDSAVGKSFEENQIPALQVGPRNKPDYKLTEMIAKEFPDAAISLSGYADKSLVFNKDRNDLWLEMEMSR